MYKACSDKLLAASVIEKYKTRSHDVTMMKNRFS